MTPQQGLFTTGEVASYWAVNHLTDTTGSEPVNSWRRRRLESVTAIRSMAGTTVDVSRAGLLIRLTAPIEPRTLLSVQIFLGDDEPPTMLGGEPLDPRG